MDCGLQSSSVEDHDCSCHALTRFNVLSESSTLVSDPLVGKKLTNICCSGGDADSDEFYENESIGDESLENEGLEEGIVDLNPELKKALVDAQWF
ncbi:hypothetical protein OUZ56_023761 [Daphnia magna]|uniref:Uncharacterized protein n=1 Tax=Daphnia magna TaxID=35525 RepID=A0ABR0AZG3_9CRUS|nr:hypothetical protein OUZ56_023761 [Daphnia magna]